MFFRRAAQRETRGRGAEPLTEAVPLDTRYRRKVHVDEDAPWGVKFEPITNFAGAVGVTRPFVHTHERLWAVACLRRRSVASRPVGV